MGVELRLTILNDLEELVRVNDCATQLLEGARVAAKKVYLTCLALEEILSNVIRHGYEDEAVHEIAVSIREDDGIVELEIVDDGKEFDPRAAPEVDVLAPLADRPVGGLGIHLLKHMIGDIRYERSNGRNRHRVRL